MVLPPLAWNTHLSRDKIESNFSVPGIQGHRENALIKSFEMSRHLICLLVSTKIPLGPASGFRLALKGCWCKRTDI